MKKLLLALWCLFTVLFASHSFAEQTTGAGTMNTITELINSMASGGIIDADVARYKISYYHDQIFLYGTNLTAVLTGSEEWARSETWNVISKKLYSLKDQWYITKDKYESYIQSYTGMISTGALLQLGTIYKDFVRLEKGIIEKDVVAEQKTLYNTYKNKLGELLEARRITEEKYYTWLVKIEDQVYRFKSDPDRMAQEFDEEAARHTEILPIVVDYASEVRTQYEKQYTKMSLRTLQLTLTRIKKLEKKYKDGTKNKIKAQAQIELLNKMISKKSVKK